MGEYDGALDLPEGASEALRSTKGGSDLEGLVPGALRDYSRRDIRSSTASIRSLKLHQQSPTPTLRSKCWHKGIRTLSCSETHGEGGCVVTGPWPSRNSHRALFGRSVTETHVTASAYLFMTGNSQSIAMAGSVFTNLLGVAKVALMYRISGQLFSILLRSVVLGDHSVSYHRKQLGICIIHGIT